MARTKRKPREKTAREVNPDAPLFGDAEGGICRAVREPIAQRLIRQYGDSSYGSPPDVITWMSYEVGKAPYERVEFRHKRKIYTGLGEHAWSEIQAKLPRLPDDEFEISIVATQRWMIVYLYRDYEAWRCEGTNFWELFGKLLRRAIRATYVARGQESDED